MPGDSTAVGIAPAWLTPNALGPGIETPIVTVCGGTRLSGTFSATAQKSITV